MENNPFEGQSFRTPEEELSYLREALRQKEQALENMSAETRIESPAAFKEVATEYASMDNVLGGDLEKNLESVEREVLNLEPEKHDEGVFELMQIAKEKGIQHTLKAVRALGNPHLEDDFHRYLAEYVKTGYEKNVPGIESSKRLFRALNLALFEVTVSKSDLDSEERDAFKSTQSRMQELFAGLRSVAAGSGGNRGFYFAIEIALENSSSNVRFFVAIPKNRVELFEKQFSALFPSAKLTYAQNDYNIFNENGAVSISDASLKEHPAFPIRTIESFDSDPLNTILNTFTQLNLEGEGAALQLLFSPQNDVNLNNFRNIKKKLESGSSVKEATSSESIMGEFGKFFFGAPAKPVEEEKQIDTKAVENVSEKISSALYSVNMRVVVSAATEARAQDIREGIESAFSQFDREGSNYIQFREARGRAAERLIRQFTFRFFDEKKALFLNLREASTLIHIPGPGTHVLRSVGSSGRESGAPPSDLPTSGLLLGRNVYRGRERDVYISPDDRLRHLYVIGQTGTGKSTMLKNMIIQDIQNGEGVCMIDPHGSDIEDVLAAVPKERYDDVIYFDPSDQSRPMGLNMLEFDRTRPEQKTFVVNEMLSIFNKLFDMKAAGGPMFEQYFRNAVLLVLEGDEPATLLDVSRVLSDQDFRNKKISESFNPVVIQFWNEVASKAGGEAALQNIVPYITSKFDVFLSNDVMRPIIAQQYSSFNFREIMDERKILLVNLSKGRLGDIDAALIGLIVVGKLLLAALSRVDTRGGDFPPFYLYLDEFQNITTDSIAVILSEARKYKLSLTVAHQFIAQLSDPIRNAVFGNVGSLVSFRVGVDDAEYLEKTFSPTFTSRDIVNTENRHALLKLLIHGAPRDPFAIKTMPPFASNDSQIEYLKGLSREKYGRDRVEVERSVIANYRKL